MFGDPFYHSTMKKTVVAFGSLFNNLYVTRDQDGNTVKIKVPIIYSGKEKFVARYKDTLNKANNDVAVVQTLLPKMGFEIQNIAYDASRKKPSVNKRIVERTSGSDVIYKANFAEVPYNVNFVLTSYTRYLEDGLQMAEQILPFFTPDFTVAIKQDVLDETGEKMNIPFVLNSVNQVNDFEGALELNPRIIMWDYTFTAKINLFGPLPTTEIIKHVQVNLKDIIEIEGEE